ncbi:MAG: glycosyltransferase [Vulcanimicrobiaceae bacterium]
MRILVCTTDFPSPLRPGAGIFILRLLEALRPFGYEFEVLRIVPHAPPIGTKWRAYRSIAPVESVAGFPVRTIRAFFPPRMIAMEYLPLQVHGSVEREIARFRPDVLHAHYVVPAGQVAVRHRVPTVVTAHGGDAYKSPFKRPGLYRAAHEALSKATRVTAVSNYLRERIRSIVPRDVRVIWNGADERFFYPRERTAAREALDLPSGRLIVAFVGNLLRAKGVYDLVDAVDALARRGYHPLLVVAGHGPERAALQAAALQHRVEARFLGQLDPAGVAQLYGAADIVTLPSHAEGLPNVVCEAMLSGRAVVATSVGGIPEILENERTGSIVSAGKPDELMQAFETLASDAALRERIGGAARAFASAHLTWPIAAAGYDSVFREIVDAPSAPAQQAFQQTDAVAEM